MGRKILFSPVGGTDPMPESNYKDGSMIHISRIYKPDLVILYLSKEMLEKEKADNRYTYSIEQLAKLQKRKIDYKIIERPELVNVHDFDYFYGDFRDIVKALIDEMEEDDELLFNISSGTPAMKSCLLTLNHLWEDSCKSIQVSTPIGAMNDHNHSKKSEDYDIRTRWELNEDNYENFENRCKEIECISLKQLKNEELIKKLIDEYDYDAAYSIATYEDMKNSSKNYIDYLEIAKHRLLQDLKTVDKIINKAEIKSEIDKNIYNPVKGSNVREYFEYILSLDIKIKKKQYADFIRAISPIIKDIFILIINKHLKIDIYSELCDNNNKSRKYVWSEEKLNKHEEILKILQAKYKNNFKYGDLSADHFKYIILETVKNKDIKEVVENLRSVEERVRNIAAHEIVSVTENFIKERTGGYTSKQIINDIKKALAYAGINISANDYNSYKYMNEDIKSRIK
jgi:hypothetical protein